MKRSLLAVAVFATLFTACQKQGSTTNVTNVYSNDIKPSYAISGLHDITVGAGTTGTSFLIGINYQDSAQEVVTLSLNTPPVGIDMDTTWIKSGYPTFNTSLHFYDTLGTAIPGAYGMVLTCTGTRTGARTFPFTLTVQ